MAQQCELSISNSTDWAAVYAQLAFLQLSDPIFYAANFNKTPVNLISCVLHHFYLHMQQRINAESVSTAKLSMLVYGALGGKAHKASLESFLPYEMQTGADGLSDSTKKALKWALKNKQMPPAIVGLIGADLN